MKPVNATDLVRSFAVEVERFITLLAWTLESGLVST